MVSVPSLKGGRNARGSATAAAKASKHTDGRTRHQRARMRERPAQHRAIGALQIANQPAFVLVEPLQARQQVVGHHRRQRDGDDEACENRDDVGLAERREETAFDAGQREQRHEDEHDDHRRVDDAGADFLAGADDDIERRARIARLAVLAQAAKDVLDVDDGVIDQLADGDGETAERHGVDGEAERVEDDGGRQDRDGNGRQRDEGRAHIEQEQEQDDGDNRHGLEQDLLDVADRGFDEVRLPEDDVVDLDALRHGLIELGDGALDLAGQLHGVDRRLLLDRDDDGGPAHEAGFATLQAGAVADLGDLMQIDRPAAFGADDDIAKILELERAPDVADQELAAVLVGKAAAGVGAEALQRAFHLLERDAEGAHRRRIRRNPELPDLAADRDDLGDAGDGQQARPDDEIGNLAHLHRACRLRRHGKHEDLPHDGVDRPHLRRDVGGKLLLDEPKPLGDLLTIAEDVGAPVELDIDDRQADARDRAHARDAGQPVHLCLDRKRDELLDFGRREPFGLGHDGDGRTVEVREDVDRQPLQGEGAVEHHDGRHGQHQKPVAQRAGDEKGEHACLLPDLVQEFGALRDDALARLDAGDDQNARAIERLDAHLARDEALGIAVLVDDALAVCAAQNGFSRDRDAGALVGRRGEHRHELTGAQACCIALDREVNGNGLIAVGKPGADIDEIDGAAAGEQALCRSARRLRLEAQSLDPQTGGIDDLENDGVGLGHLSGDGIRGGDARHRPARRAARARCWRARDWRGGSASPSARVRRPRAGFWRSPAGSRASARPCA